MDELTRALQTVLDVAVRLGVPVLLLFLVGCLIHYREDLQRFVARLTGRNGGSSTPPVQL
jgi:hypothetical protein